MRLLSNNSIRIGNMQVRHPVESPCSTNNSSRTTQNFGPRSGTWKLNLTQKGLSLQSILAIANIIFSQSLRTGSHSCHQSTSSFTNSIDGTSTTASRAMTPDHDSSGWPLNYPLAILWTFEDCKTDLSIDFMAANEACIALCKIIQHHNRTMITHSAVKAISGRARPIVNKMLAQVGPHIQDKEIGKIYFWATYPAEWDAACQELESTQPLLKLCAGHWKAEFVLAQVIKSTK